MHTKDPSFFRDISERNVVFSTRTPTIKNTDPKTFLVPHHSSHDYGKQLDGFVSEYGTFIAQKESLFVSEYQNSTYAVCFTRQHSRRG